MMDNQFVSIGFKTLSKLAFLDNPVKTLFVARIEHPKPLSTTMTKVHMLRAHIPRRISIEPRLACAHNFRMCSSRI